MPPISDEQKQIERTNKLKSLLQSSWQHVNISILPPHSSGEPNLLKAEKSTNKSNERDIAVIFKPSRELMTDEDNNYSEVFHKGIRLAEQIFNFPPNLSITLQGTIVLTSEHATFEPRNKLGHTL